MYCAIEITPESGHWWLTSVILASQEAEIRRIMVQSQPKQTVCKTLPQKIPITKKGWWSKYEPLSSNLRAAKKTNKKITPELASNSDPCLTESFVLFCFLTQGLTMEPRLASDSRSSCLSLLSAGITGMNHHTSLSPDFY
jgi:hypothetical protein